MCCRTTREALTPLRTEVAAPRRATAAHAIAERAADSHSRRLARSFEGKPMARLFSVIVALWLVLGLIAVPADEARAQPACNIAGWHSADGNQAARLVFVNQRQEPVQIFWINYQGGQQLYTTLAPGGNWSVDSFVTHPWIVKTMRGDCVEAFVAEGNATIAIRP
jgi:hypothetical protein